MTWDATQSGRLLVLSLGWTELSVYIDISFVRNIEVKEVGWGAVMSLELTIQFVIMIVAVADLFYQIDKRK